MVLPKHVAHDVVLRTDLLTHAVVVDDRVVPVTDLRRHAVLDVVLRTDLPARAVVVDHRVVPVTDLRRHAVLDVVLRMVLPMHAALDVVPRTDLPTHAVVGHHAVAVSDPRRHAALDVVLRLAEPIIVVTRASIRHVAAVVGVADIMRRVATVVVGEVTGIMPEPTVGLTAANITAQSTAATTHAAAALEGIGVLPTKVLPTRAFLRTAGSEEATATITVDMGVAITGVATQIMENVADKESCTK
jgi:hypothetical protein